MESVFVQRTTPYNKVGSDPYPTDWKYEAPVILYVHGGHSSNNTNDQPSTTDTNPDHSTGNR